MHGKRLIMISLVVVGTDAMALEDNDPLILEPMKIPKIIVNPTPLYVGLGFTTGALRIGTSKLDFNHNAKGQDRVGSLSALFGYDIYKNIAIEGRYMSSFIKESLANIQSLGVLFKPHISLVDEMTGYALLGYGTSTLSGVKRHTMHISESSFQWGFGLEYDTSETFTYFVDYTNLLQNVKNISTDALTIGIKYRF